MDKIARGFCHVSNPFNGKVEQVSLKPEDVDAIVFWTRNCGPMLEALPRLADIGYRFYFQFTIIGYPKIIDPGSPAAGTAVELAHKLRKSYGPRCAIWRYDPIVLTSITPERWHLENFGRLAQTLEGAADTCVISFIDHYKKLDRNFDPVLDEHGATMADPGWDALKALAEKLARIAGRHGIALATCCEPQLGLADVPQGRCIDPARLADVTGRELSGLKTNPTRRDCLCAVSKDIGAYDTCPAGCAYCYANFSRARSKTNLKKLKPSALSLTPG